METTRIKLLKLIDILACSSFLILSLYLSFKILVKVIYHGEGKLSLILFALLTIHAGLTIFFLIRTLNSTIILTKKTIDCQNLFAGFILMFAAYLDFFVFRNVGMFLDFLNLENLTIFITILIFNFFIFWTILFTVYLWIIKGQFIK